MPLGVFTLFTLIGSLVWNTVLVTAGYLLAEQWERLLEYTEPFQTLVMALIGALVVALVCCPTRSLGMVATCLVGTGLGRGEFMAGHRVGCVQSAVISVMAARAEDSSTMAFLVA
jgi:hypothetical protein